MIKPGSEKHARRIELTKKKETERRLKVESITKEIEKIIGKPSVSKLRSKIVNIVSKIGDWHPKKVHTPVQLRSDENKKNDEEEEKLTGYSTTDMISESYEITKSEDGRSYSNDKKKVDINPSKKINKGKDKESAIKAQKSAENRSVADYNNYKKGTEKMIKEISGRSSAFPSLRK